MREAAQGRLLARPKPNPPGEPLSPGRRRLGLRERRDAWVFTPQGLQAGRPAPLLLTLHGAGGDAPHMLDMMAGEADRRGVVLLSPASAGSTWDVIRGGFGPDVAAIDRALALVFEQFPVDPGRVGVGGFSDGASYALSLGLGNGDLFSDVLAFSPGFAAPDQTLGQPPRVFISHGTEDGVLPIGRCGRPLAKRLASAGYDVDYREFRGGHMVPPELMAAAFERFVGPAEQGVAAPGSSAV